MLGALGKTRGLIQTHKCDEMCQERKEILKPSYYRRYIIKKGKSFRISPSLCDTFCVQFLVFEHKILLHVGKHSREANISPLEMFQGLQQRTAL